MNKFFIVLLLSTIFFHNGFGQNKKEVSGSNSNVHTKYNIANELETFQNGLQSSVKKVYPASVRIITHERLTPSGGVMASGVCVTKDGIIMTAGHLTVPGGDYTIIFPGGKDVKAKGLGKIGLLDLGLLKITEVGTFPYAEMGWSSSLTIGEPCFSLAYPGSFSDKLVLRFGEVLGKDVGQFHSLQTSCLMEPGDSGGPVFDMNGRVIGIRSYIGMPLNENYEVAVDNYRKYWKELETPKNYPGVPEADAGVNDASGKAYNGLPWHDINKEIHSLEERLSEYTVEIKSNDSDSTRSVLGTVVDLKALSNHKRFLKGSFVVSKSSEVGNGARVILNSKPYAAKIIYRDNETDLVLLQIDGRSKTSLRVFGNVSDSLDINDLGKLLISPFPIEGGVMSALGTTTFTLPGIYDAGYLGVKVELLNGITTITHVQPNTAADKSMLKEGDVIVSINEVKVNTPDDFINVLKGSKVGQIISLTYRRNGKTDKVNITLKGRPFQGSGHIAEQFTDGRSERRDDFKHVFIHDAKLKPSECGGPIFDLRGNFIGINMARYSRTSSIGMPAGEVVWFLEEAIGDAN